MANNSEIFAYVPDIFELLPDRQYECEICDNKTFKNRSPYILHLKNSHHIEIEENEVYKCPAANCDYFRGTLIQLRRHYQTKHMEKKICCNKCDRKFLVESQFKRHKCSTVEYSCHLCHKTFNMLSPRNKHMRNCKGIIPKFGSKLKKDLEVAAVLTDEVFIDEMIKLIRRIQNKTLKDTKLVRELAKLTPHLQRLQGKP